MRSEWVPMSASALVTGVMALVLGAALSPSTGGGGSAAFQAVADNSGRWLAMAVLFFGASVAMTLGLPAILTLFTRRGRRLGLFAVAVFSIGVIGTSGYAMLMVFFRAMVLQGAVRGNGARLDAVVQDNGLAIFLYGWIVAFYAGILLLALALLRARRTPPWVSILLIAFVAVFPFTGSLGRVAEVVQMLALAVAFTGIAMAVTSPEHRAELLRQSSP
jgi:hypothetical protein